MRYQSPSHLVIRAYRFRGGPGLECVFTPDAWGPLLWLCGFFSNESTLQLKLDTVKRADDIGYGAIIWYHMTMTRVVDFFGRSYQYRPCDSNVPRN